ncbi:MAG: glutamine amidotransferase [Steroidobacteraceae bacterium]
MPAKLALAVRHVAFEDCGTLADVLAERGFAVRYADVGRIDLREVDSVAPDLLVGLGGPIAVYDEALYPWITQELRLFERRLRAAKPTLGICLGAQMLAHALGARVYAGPVKELGWKPLKLTPQGERSVVAPLASHSTSMFHWHGDTFDLPAGATLLASTAQVAQQVYAWGPSVLAFQCHPEIRAADIESWLIGHACELAATRGAEGGPGTGNGARGTDVAQLRRDSEHLGPALAQRARTMFESWLAAVGL